MFDDGEYTVHLEPMTEHQPGKESLWQLSVYKTRGKRKTIVVSKKNITHANAMKIIKELKEQLLLFTPD